MVYTDALLEAQRNIQTHIAMVVASIVDVATRQYVALRFADILSWGDGQFSRAAFLACCGVDEAHMGSSYITLAEEM